MRVLVTGSSGVIGRELLRLLLDKNLTIMSVDRLPLPRELIRDNVIHIQRDIAESPLYELHTFQPEVIFHLAAAFERTLETKEFWRISWHDDTVLSHNILDIAKDLHSLQTFVFASSYLIYDPTLYTTSSLVHGVTRLVETEASGPRNLTGASKHYTEKELEFLSRHQRTASSLLRVINCRIFRVYGIGSRDVISRWVRSALKGQQIEIYNAANTFDYVWAGDVAQGMIRLVESDNARGVVNLGSGVPRSITDVLNVLRTHFPHLSDNIVHITGEAAFEKSCADLSQLQALTNWIPKTSLEEGIAQLIKYERSVFK